MPDAPNSSPGPIADPRAQERAVELAKENARLREQLHVLDEQVKRIFKTEQRLFAYQKELDRQLRRINAVNQFALEASTVLEPRHILETAIETLMEVLALDQGIGILRTPEGAVRVVAVRAARGMERNSAALLEADGGLLDTQSIADLSEPLLGTTEEIHAQAPSVSGLLAALERYYGDDDDATDKRAVAVFLPLQGKRSTDLIGAVVIRKRDILVSSSHDTLPHTSDIPFLKLLAGHLASTLESALLHEQVASFAAAMEARVDERTEALLGLNHELQASLKELRETQGQLFQAGKMAAIGTLVAGLSHELNTPLGVILGYSQAILTREHSDPTMHNALVAIERQAKRAHQLVQSLLDFSRNRPPTREKITPEVIVERVCDLARAQAMQSNVTLIVAPMRSPLPVLFANCNEMESALLNLISNALDAIESNGSIELGATECEIDGRPGVEFRLTDSGRGIPNEVQPWVFDPFFTTKPVGEGTGLGLALTRRIVRAHGGKIAFETRPGEGTTMRVWIPTVDALAGEPTEVIG